MPTTRHVVVEAVDQLAHRGGRELDGLLGATSGIRRHAHSGDHLAAEADDADRDGVDLRVDGDRHRLAARRDDGARPTDALGRLRFRFGNESEGGELADEGRDGRSVQAGDARELRPREAGWPSRRARDEVLSPGCRGAPSRRPRRGSAVRSGSTSRANCSPIRYLLPLTPNEATRSIPTTYPLSALRSKLSRGFKDEQTQHHDGSSPSAPLRPWLAARSPAVPAAALRRRRDVTLTWWHNATGDPLQGLLGGRRGRVRGGHPGVTVEVSGYQNEDLQRTLIPNALASGDAAGPVPGGARRLVARRSEAGYLKDSHRGAADRSTSSAAP